MKELLIATGNQGKFKEIADVLNGLIDVRFLSLQELGLSSEGLIEDGESFKENAYKKARFFYEHSGLLTLAEDSGLMVDALEGELGVQTRRWGAGENASDEEWIEVFLKRMAGEKERRARFVCNACLMGTGIEKYFSGETLGVITEGLEGPMLPGLPLSSCFLPEGCETVYAALGAKGKSEVSHRGKAMKEAGEWILNNINF